MKLTKDTLVKSIQSENNLSENRSKEIVESIISIIKDALISGEDVMISGFGKFCVSEKAERNGGRNFKTGEIMVLRPRRVVTFKCSGKLRRKMNGT